MATITANTSEKVFPLSAFLGLNENPDGDTKLRMGEAVEVRNWAITRDRNLRRRAGTKTVLELGSGPVMGLWTGFVNGEEVFLAACDGKLWKLEAGDEWKKQSLGSIDTSQEVCMFGFSGIVYILNGKEYKQWDGATLKDVEGYVPLAAISIPPSGGGELLENVNRLTGKRRAWISPDGKGTVFQLPEKGIQSVDYVKDLATGKAIAANAYTVNLAAGTVTFQTAPAQGTNSYEIGWTMGTTFRDQVCKMRFAELYNGSQDTRVFLYGDGSNRCLYSGLDYDGQPRADYFPDLYECAIGDANTPITSLIRQYANLICFKSGSTYSIRFGLVTLANGLETAGFYATPVNRTIGNAALGQVQLVLNTPRTLFGADLYEWKNSGSRTANLTSDERQAQRISDRIYNTLRGFDLSRVYCYDDNYNQEYYVCFDGRALVHNYAADAWYSYTEFPVSTMCSYHDELYIGSPDGKLKHVSYEHKSDDGRPIKAYWESGSMSFGQDYQRKYSAQLWIGIKPESHGEVEVTVQTDRKSGYAEKEVLSELITLRDANFGRWTFENNRRPQMQRLKIKAKKFVFYKLIFKNESAEAGATVLAADIRVRFTGYAK